MYFLCRLPSDVVTFIVKHMGTNITSHAQGKDLVSLGIWRCMWWWAIPWHLPFKVWLPIYAFILIHVAIDCIHRMTRVKPAFPKVRPHWPLSNGYSLRGPVVDLVQAARSTLTFTELLRQDYKHSFLYKLNSKDQHKRHKDTYVVLWRVRQGRKKRIYERWSLSSTVRKGTRPNINQTLLNCWHLFSIFGGKMIQNFDSSLDDIPAWH